MEKRLDNTQVLINIKNSAETSQKAIIMSQNRSVGAHLSCAFLIT